jgi:hypothetical protein
MMSINEKRYWQDQAALLDPASYVMRSKQTQGAAWTETVPAGECWYFLNSFFVRVSGGDAIYNHRVPDVAKATQLGAGTKIEFHSDSAYSYHYTCRPELVICKDKRYQDDPKGLYYQRMNRLRSLPSLSHRVDFPSGSPYGVTADVLFPDDLGAAMCLSYSNSNASWGALIIAGGALGAMNVGNEISDDHQNRIGERTMFPFARSVFTGLRARGGSVLGGNDPYIKGNAQITYCKLPADW